MLSERLAVAVLLAAAIVGPGHSQSRKDGARKLPMDHPAVATPDRREGASRLTEQVAGGQPAASAGRVPRRNFIDDFIFGRMERDGIPHAPLASDADFTSTSTTLFT